RRGCPLRDCTQSLALGRVKTQSDLHGDMQRQSEMAARPPPSAGHESNRTDVMKLQIKVDPATGRIEDAKFKTFGCGSAIASSSLATEWLKGKTVEEAMDIKNTSIVEELSLPPVKVHCSVLAEDAIKAAVKDYQQKQQAHEGQTQEQPETVNA